MSLQCKLEKMPDSITLYFKIYNIYYPWIDMIDYKRNSYIR